MALTATASAILEHMEPDRIYEAQQLRALAPDLTQEGLNDVMRELWVRRQVERVGYTGWRRERSASPVDAMQRPGPDSRSAGANAGRPKRVRPEDLFDHSAFDGMFK